MTDFWKSHVQICLISLLLSGTAQEAGAVGKLILTWNDPADNETGFTIERTKTADGTVALLSAPANPQGDQTTYNDTGVVAGNQYCYRVKAFNVVGESAYSNSACGVLSDDTDGDGLTDEDEVKQYETDPTNSDTDGDGLTDGQEVNQYVTDPINSASPLCGAGSLEQGDTMVLTDESVTDSKHYRASQSISAGPAFVITSRGCARFSAAGTIRLRSGFRVNGGVFEANISR